MDHDRVMDILSKQSPVYEDLANALQNSYLGVFRCQTRDKLREVLLGVLGSPLTNFVFTQAHRLSKQIKEPELGTAQGIAFDLVFRKYADLEYPPGTADKFMNEYYTLLNREPGDVN